MELDDYLERFGPNADRQYLEDHFPRFIGTWKRAKERWTWTDACVLDVGAHWLYQSVLFALDGHQVIAADLANPLDLPEAIATAEAHGIRRIVYETLNDSTALDALPESSVDVVLFCEILEHLTFNPVAMWKAIYRVLRPGGRIILTTPNYYSLAAMGWRFRRFFSGHGGGISISDILHVPTHSPHWKEYSAREIEAYFYALSNDFEINVMEQVSWSAEHEELNWKGRLAHDRGNLLPPFKDDLYAEIDLVEKSAGINIEPGWD